MVLGWLKHLQQLNLYPFIRMAKIKTMVRGYQSSTASTLTIPVMITRFDTLKSVIACACVVHRFTTLYFLRWVCSNRPRAKKTY